MKANLALLVFIFMVAGLMTAGQEKDKRQPSDLETWISKMPEEARQKYERLQKADFARLELEPRLLELGEDQAKLKEHYKEGDRVFFRLLITNNSLQSVQFSSADYYQEQRPKLLRDGDEVAYRSNIVELVEAKESDPVGRSTRAVSLEPGKTVTEHVNLSDWYGSLKHGHYELTVRRRFVIGGKWIESPAISFEVDSGSKAKY